MSNNDIQAIEAYYDDYGTWYESERREGYYAFINDLEFEKIRLAVTNRDVLEIGCGTGLILERSAAVARSATGVDLSDGMLNTARKKGLAVAKGSATDLDFPDASFDVVYSFKVFPHIPDVARAVAEATRVTKPGGSMFLEFYNPVSLKALANHVSFGLRSGKDVYCRFDRPADIRRYLPVGWQVRSARGVRIFAPVAACYTMPLVADLFRLLERRACDTWLSRFGGYYIVELGRNQSEA